MVAIFAQAMLEGMQPQIFGDGNQERHFVYVDDVIDANLRAMYRSNGEAFNIGTGGKTSVNRIFELLLGIIRYRRLPERGPSRLGEGYQISLDNDKAAMKLGWTPQTKLEDGLRQTVEYFRKLTGSREQVTGCS